MNGENITVEELQKIEVMKKTILKKILTKQANERLGRIKLVKPDLANQLELYLVQLYQTGKINQEITDDQLRTILEQIATKQKFRILK